MLVVYKRVGTVGVRVNISVSKHESQVSGEAYPFGKPFHNVAFSASREVDFRSADQKVQDAVVEIGFGGNRFQGAKAARILQAAQVAYEQANYYADLNNDIAEGQYAQILHSAVVQGNAELVMDCLLLTPSGVDKDQKTLVRALKRLLEDAPLLGAPGAITAENFDLLAGISEKTGFYGLMKACGRVEGFDPEVTDTEERIEATKKMISHILAL